MLTQTSTEPHTPQQNRTELEIRDTKDHYRRIIWHFGITYTTDVRQVIARPNLDYRSAIEVLTGNSPDISNFLDFGFYQWIKYFDPAAFPSSREILGRWLGYAHGVGQALCYYVLKDNGQVIAHSTVRSLTPEEMTND